MWTWEARMTKPSCKILVGVLKESREIPLEAVDQPQGRLQIQQQLQQLQQVQLLRKQYKQIKLKPSSVVVPFLPSSIITAPPTRRTSSKRIRRFNCSRPKQRRPCRLRASRQRPSWKFPALHLALPLRPCSSSKISKNIHPSPKLKETAALTRRIIIIVVTMRLRRQGQQRSWMLESRSRLG